MQASLWGSIPQPPRFDSKSLFIICYYLLSFSLSSLYWESSYLQPMYFLYRLAAVAILGGIAAAIYGVVTQSLFHLIWVVAGIFFYVSITHVIRNYKDYKL